MPPQRRGVDITASTLQEGQLVDVSAFEVQLNPWRTKFSAGVAPTQPLALFDSCYFCLDALTDLDVRRQAKEYVRTLGGQVCCIHALSGNALRLFLVLCASLLCLHFILNAYLLL